ncbi:MAG: tRNA-dihydrouridine synthase family protein [Candidatus Saccharibacteria bacterium]|nr:tRNA-dihydrouridine synthase family protein [Candidatus Saccharibacteria bacterium]
MNIWENLSKPFLILAPMEGVTDIMFRQVVAKAGRPDLFFTEFTNVSSYASKKGRDNALERLEIAETDAPIIAQIWGKDPEHFEKTASALEELGFAGIDLNFGCPDKNVNKTGGGAAMIKTPDLAIDCFRRAKKATNLPVSVKTRLGWSNPEEYKTWLPVLLAENPAALTVHLRTKKEMSKVEAHYELIPKILKLRNEISPKTKLIINGDIKNKSEALALYEKYPEVDGFMIGRGVFTNPYCFTDHTGTREELMELLKLHLSLYEVQAKKYAKHHPGKTLSYEPLKHFFKIYINNFPGASDLRAKLMGTHNINEARNIIYSYDELTI